MFVFVSASMASEHQSPYAGQEQRQIKSLSVSEIQGYLNGSGLGYAKAAELNHYPGPKHVLELAKQIHLSTEQIAKTEKLYASMKQKASELGGRFVEKERELDIAFATDSIDADSLRNLLAEIEALEAEIRYVHLNAHLAQRAILSQKQVQRYVELRGYNGNHDKIHH
jgi:Spy/CpxP family protein refolding chaperone